MGPVLEQDRARAVVALGWVGLSTPGNNPAVLMRQLSCLANRSQFVRHLMRLKCWMKLAVLAAVEGPKLDKLRLEFLLR
jgi:hypothetical protein